MVCVLLAMLSVVFVALDTGQAHVVMQLPAWSWLMVGISVQVVGLAGQGALLSLSLVLLLDR